MAPGVLPGHLLCTRPGEPSQASHFTPPSHGEVAIGTLTSQLKTQRGQRGWLIVQKYTSAGATGGCGPVVGEATRVLHGGPLGSGHRRGSMGMPVPATYPASGQATMGLPFFGAAAPGPCGLGQKGRCSSEPQTSLLSFQLRDEKPAPEIKMLIAGPAPESGVCIQEPFITPISPSSQPPACLLWGLSDKDQRVRWEGLGEGRPCTGSEDQATRPEGPRQWLPPRVGSTLTRVTAPAPWPQRGADACTDLVLPSVC